MSEALKPCPFCGAKPIVKVEADYYPPSDHVSGWIYCPECRPNTNNPIERKTKQVQQSVFWTGKEILKHVPEGLTLEGEGTRFHSTTARAAKAAAREIVIEKWQRRI